MKTTKYRHLTPKETSIYSLLYEPLLEYIHPITSSYITMTLVELKETEIRIIIKHTDPNQYTIKTLKNQYIFTVPELPIPDFKIIQSKRID